MDKSILKTPKTQELVDTYFRLAADFDNFRKRAEGNLVQAKVFFFGVRGSSRVFVQYTIGCGRGAVGGLLRPVVCCVVDGNSL